MIRRNVYNDGNVERRDSCGKKQYRYLLSDVAFEIGKWQEDRLAKRFEIARQIYNTMVRAELKSWSE